MTLNKSVGEQPSNSSRYQQGQTCTPMPCLAAPVCCICFAAWNQDGLEGINGRVHERVHTAGTEDGDKRHGNTFCILKHCLQDHMGHGNTLNMTLSKSGVGPFEKRAVILDSHVHD